MILPLKHSFAVREKECPASARQHSFDTFETDFKLKYETLPRKSIKRYVDVGHLFPGNPDISKILVMQIKKVSDISLVSYVFRENVCTLFTEEFVSPFGCLGIVYVSPGQRNKKLFFHSRYDRLWQHQR